MKIKFLSIRKFIVLIFLILVFSCKFSYANNVKNIYVGITINDDGSAYII